MLTQSISSAVTQQTLIAHRHVKSWRETSYDELTGGPALTRARVYNTFAGDLDGESWEEYLLVCLDDNTRSFVSSERFVGSLGGRVGSFVMQGVGTYENGVTRGHLVIVPGSGTGELTDLRGSGEFVGSKGRPSTVTLVCELEELTI